MTNALWMLFSGIVLAVLCGLGRLAFGQQEPYRRLFKMINDGIFLLNTAYCCGMLGYIIGVGVTLSRYQPEALESYQPSLWMFAPNVVLTGIWAICYVLLILPRHIGLTDDQ